MLAKVEVILLMFILVLTSCYGEKNTCDKETIQKLDESTGIILGQFGIAKYKWPENEAQMEAYCKNISNTEDYIKAESKRCLKGLSKTIMSVTAYSIKASNKPICGSKATNKNDFIARGKCGNKAKKDTTKCWKTNVHNIISIKNITDAKQKLPLVCCSYFGFRSCIIKALTKRGSQVCPQTAVDGFEAHINRLSLDTLNVICRELSIQNDRCPQMLKQLPKPKKGKRNKNMPKTMLIPLIDVLESL